MSTNQNMIYERTERISTFMMKDVTLMIVKLCYREEELKSFLFLFFYAVPY
jgi:hypothetical protein